MAEQTPEKKGDQNPFLMTAAERLASAPQQEQGYVDHNPVRIGGPEQAVSEPEYTTPEVEVPATPETPTLPEYPAGVVPVAPGASLKPGDTEVTDQPPVVSTVVPAFSPAYPSQEEVAASKEAQRTPTTPESEAIAASIAAGQPEFTPSSPAPVAFEGLSEDRTNPNNPIQFTPEAAVDAAKSVSDTTTPPPAA